MLDLQPIKQIEETTNSLGNNERLPISQWALSVLTGLPSSWPHRVLNQSPRLSDNRPYYYHSSRLLFFVQRRPQMSVTVLSAGTVTIGTSSVHTAIPNLPYRMFDMGFLPLLHPRPSDGVIRSMALHQHHIERPCRGSRLVSADCWSAFVIDR